jgi:hypothetical protein
MNSRENPLWSIIVMILKILPARWIEGCPELFTISIRQHEITNANLGIILLRAIYQLTPVLLWYRVGACAGCV